MSKIISEPTSTTSKEDDPIALAEQKAAEYLDGWQRAKADFVNREKEYEKQRAEFLKFAAAGCVREFLSTYTALDTACEKIPDDIAETEWTKGIVQIRANMWHTLEQMGVSRIPTDDAFDPLVHEAVSKLKVDKESGSIVEEVGAGYAMNGIALVPAKVIIAE
jgi:molecular chaperone GrpE